MKCHWNILGGLHLQRMLEVVWFVCDIVCVFSMLEQCWKKQWKWKRLLSCRKFTSEGPLLLGDVWHCAIPLLSSTIRRLYFFLFNLLPKHHFSAIQHQKILNWKPSKRTRSYKIWVVSSIPSDFVWDLCNLFDSHHVALEFLRALDRLAAWPNTARCRWAQLLSQQPPAEVAGGPAPEEPRSGWDVVSLEVGRDDELTVYMWSYVYL